MTLKADNSNSNGTTVEHAPYLAATVVPTIGSIAEYEKAIAKETELANQTGGYTSSEEVVIDLPFQEQSLDEINTSVSQTRATVTTQQYSSESFQEQLQDQADLNSEQALDNNTFSPEFNNQVIAQVETSNIVKLVGEPVKNHKVDDFASTYDFNELSVSLANDKQDSINEVRSALYIDKTDIKVATNKELEPVVSNSEFVTKHHETVYQESERKYNTDKEQLDTKKDVETVKTKVVTPPNAKDIRLLPGIETDVNEVNSILDNSDHATTNLTVKEQAKDIDEATAVSSESAIADSSVDGLINANNIKSSKSAIESTSKNAELFARECAKTPMPDMQKIMDEDPTIQDHGDFRSKEYIDFQGNKRQVKLSKYYPEYIYDVEDLFKESEVLLEGEDLVKTFKIRKGLFKTSTLEAVKDVNFTLRAGETLSIVGESGSGKTTLAKMLIGILDPTKGKIKFKGENVDWHNKEQRRKMRKEIQVVFQNPHASLNPRKTIYKILEEPLLYNTNLNAEQRKELIEKSIQTVGLSVTHLTRYPHMFSGGQKQRIAIAKGLILNPSIVVADEAVSALDVSVQAQILNLMLELQKIYNTSYVFISHDLSVVRHISHRVIVMYHGEIVETGTVEEIFNNPQHEYTKQLLAAIPKLPPCVIKRHTAYNL